MKKLMVGVMMVFAANAATAASGGKVDGFTYVFYSDTKTATLAGLKESPSSLVIDINEVEYNGVTYSVTAIGEKVFQDCDTLTSVSLPNVKEIPANAFSNCTSLASVKLPKATSIEENAFLGCSRLETVVLSWELLAKQDRTSWGLRDESEIVGPNTKEEIENVDCTIMGVARLIGGTTNISKSDYEKACECYGITPKEAKVVGGDETVVKLTELQAAKAEMVKVEGGVVTLGVSVCSNANCQAESKSWGKVKFTKEDLDVNEDGTQIIIRIPVDSQQGFMILQSGDAKVEPVQ